MMQTILITAAILIVWLLCSGFMVLSLYQASVHKDWRVRYSYSELSKLQKIMQTILAPLFLMGLVIKELVLNWHLTLAAVCILYVLKGVL